MPRLKVNQGYASLVARSADYATLRAQLQEARWLIRSLEIRNDTLLKVARTIVQRQAAFLEHGDEAMQPMILRDVAEAVEHARVDDLARHHRQVHAHAARHLRVPLSSSRATSSGAGGEDVSSVAIRARIRKLIADEEPGKPLSDAQLAEMLSREGVKVARRTVAKYREALGLASSSERRQARRARAPEQRNPIAPCQSKPEATIPNRSGGEDDACEPERTSRRRHPGPAQLRGAQARAGRCGASTA